MSDFQGSSNNDVRLKRSLDDDGWSGATFMVPSSWTGEYNSKVIFYRIVFVVFGLLVEQISRARNA